LRYPFLNCFCFFPEFSFHSYSKSSSNAPHVQGSPSPKLCSILLIHH
jgi:hypothetical protein